MNLMPGKGVGLDFERIEIQRHTQKALHAVHMNGGIRRKAVAQRGDFRNGLHRADLVVDLHERNQVDILAQQAFQRGQIHHAAAIDWYRHNFVPHAFGFLCAVQHRRMLHGQHQHPPRLMLRAQMPQNGDIVRLRAARGEHHALVRRACRFQADFTRILDGFLRIHGRAVQRRRVVPAIFQRVRHRGNHRGGGLRRRAVIQIDGFHGQFS